MIAAAVAAKLNGAAAFTFHTRRTFNLATSTYKDKLTMSNGSCKAEAVSECEALSELVYNVESVHRTPIVPAFDDHHNAPTGHPEVSNIVQVTNFEGRATAVISGPGEYRILHRWHVLDQSQLYLRSASHFKRPVPCNCR